ncbi:MAG: transcription termination factor Rho [Acidimicrobiales bacterium]
MSEGSETLERSMLEGKDREQLVAIASALGVKAGSRAKKSEIIDRILESTGVTVAAPAAPARLPLDEPAPVAQAAPAPTAPAPTAPAPVAEAAPTPPPPPAPAVRPDADTDTDDGDDDAPDGNEAEEADGPEGAEGAAGFDGESRSARRRRRRRKGGGGEPGQPGVPAPPGNVAASGPAAGAEAERRLERANDRFADRERDVSDAVAVEPVPVSGHLDLRDEGFGFLRVAGPQPSRDDVYVSVRQIRQFGLRRGDLVTGTCRPAGRNERNPALVQLASVNGTDPELSRGRRRFEDLTPLFPDQRIRLENVNAPYDLTARIIDLVSPIGKGQRGLIVAPPKAGKTSVMKTIATAIERNHPEITLMVLLIDERPEEVTDFRRSIKGEVVASTFDRPSEEHLAVAELTVERAKRLVESGKDVVLIVDGITRLARAYNLGLPPTGRVLSGGIDAGALYPPKRFFGAARNLEEGGSLTILATALVETNSRMDEAIFEEFKGTGNMELRLDRRLAERRIYPAIDLDASSTRRDDLLYERRQLQQLLKLRRVLSALGGDGSAGMELLLDRLKTFRSNEEFLTEIAKQPG